MSEGQIRKNKMDFKDLNLKYKTLFLSERTVRNLEWNDKMKAGLSFIWIFSKEHLTKNKDSCIL